MQFKIFVIELLNLRTPTTSKNLSFLDDKCIPMWHPLWTLWTHWNKLTGIGTSNRLTFAIRKHHVPNDQNMLNVQKYPPLRCSAFTFVHKLWMPFLKNRSICTSTICTNSPKTSWTVLPISWSYSWTFIERWLHCLQTNFANDLALVGLHLTAIDSSTSRIGSSDCSNWLSRIQIDPKCIAISKSIFNDHDENIRNSLLHLELHLESHAKTEPQLTRLSINR